MLSLLTTECCSVVGWRNHPTQFWKHGRLLYWPNRCIHAPAAIRRRGFLFFCCPRAHEPRLTS